jgi:hypothetical protein
MIEFDTQGNLTPHNIQEISLLDFELYFATNEYRQSLFAQYLGFIQKLKTLGVNIFHQWIDGSYITQKTIPKDIDVATFIETQSFKENEKELLNLSSLFKGIDCYFVEVFPKDVKNYNITQTDELYWYHLFQGTRKPRVKKGFIQINF